MLLELLPYEFSVCKDFNPREVDMESPFTFLSHTDGEWSLVCQSACAPKSAASREDGWVSFRVDGELDFSLVGILAGITDALAKASVSVFALSTYDTDYVLIKRDRLEDAIRALTDAGHTFKSTRLERAMEKLFGV